MRSFALVLPFALAACAMPEDSGPQQAADAAFIDLPGEYRVAGVDGGEIDLPHGITASISGDRIDIQSGCIRFAWGYTQDGNTLTTASQPVASCRRSLLPEEQAIGEAFTAAQTAARTAAGGIEFSGGGRSVLLFSQ